MYAWKDLLARSERRASAWIESERDQGHEVDPDYLPLAFPPATEAQIVAAEARLGIRLPPSLRSFYAHSDGYKAVGCFIQGLRPIGQLAWLRDGDPQLYQVLAQYEHEASAIRSLLVSSAGDASWLLLDPEVQDARGEWRAGRWSSWNPGLLRPKADFFALFEDEVACAERLLHDR